MKRNPKTRADEERLISFAREYLADGFPNPDRIGCPPVSVLQGLAEEPTAADPTITEHVGGCSPCFQQYQNLLAETRAKKRVPGLLGLFQPVPRFVVIAVICLVVIGISVVAWKIYKRATLVHQEKPKINSPDDNGNRVTQYTPFVLDLSKAAQVRGANGNKRPAMKLPRKPLHISAYLPIGSDAGEYRVSLNAGKQPVWSGIGEAQLRDQQMVMEFEADLSLNPPGRYTLTLVSKSGLRLTQQVIVEDRITAN